MLNIRQEKNRYIRDQLMAIKNVLEQTDKNVVGKALDFCCKNKVFSATGFKSVAAKYARDEPGEDLPGIPEESKEIKTINRQGNLAIEKPVISSILDYESIMKNLN